jgi:triosephosphate isomerase (TIM)
MKKLFITANWKSYKTSSQAQEWLEKCTIEHSSDKETIVCPPFTFLAQMASWVKEKNLPLKLGSQDVSPFGEGAYTGAVHAQQVKEFAQYAIIGHSERRKEFKEDDEILVKKVQMALSAGLTPIFCVQGEETPVPDGVTIVAYEPIWAIVYFIRWKCQA